MTSKTQEITSPIQPFQTSVLVPEKRLGRCQLLIAIGMICLVGSLIATAYFYVQLRYPALFIAGGGVGVLLITCCYPGTSTQRKPQKETLLNRDSLDLSERSSNPLNLLQKIRLPGESEQQNPSEKLSRNKRVSPPTPTQARGLPLLSDLQQLDLDHCLLSFLEIPSPDDPDTVDDYLLRIPLEEWLNPDPNHAWFATINAVRNDPRREAVVRDIDECIAVLEATIQLTTRLKQYPNPSLQLRDLTGNWSQSSLRWTLMSDEELSTVTLSSVKHLHSSCRCLPLLISRVKNLSLNKEKDAFDFPLTEDEVQDILLVDFPKFNAGEILQLLQSSPPIALLFLETSELNKMGVGILSPYKLQYIWSYFLAHCPS